jgi:hypothetical protein
MCTSFSKEMKSWNCPSEAARYEDVLLLVAQTMGPDIEDDETEIPELDLPSLEVANRPLDPW